jgi:hypothetical protein
MQGVDFSSLLVNFVLEYGFRKIQENQETGIDLDTSGSGLC